MLGQWSACLRLIAGKVQRETRDKGMYMLGIKSVQEAALLTPTRRVLFLALRKPRAKMQDYLDEQFKNLVYNA